MKSIFTVLLTIAFLNSSAQPGSLFSSFGNGGKVTTDMGSNNDLAYDLIVQSDGKLIVVGRTGPTSNYDFAVARYDPNGTLDATFDGDGKVVTAITGTQDVAYAVAVQNDGKILVSGGANGGPGATFCVVRYNPNGSLDNTFGRNGIVMGPFPVTFTFAGQAIALQNDGKILVGGAVTGDQLDFAVVRFNSDGSLDNSFDNDGYAQTPINPGSVDQAFVLAIQTDGKILMGGRTRQTVPSLGPFHLTLVRYNTDGSLDNNFAAGGVFTYSLPGGSDNVAYGLAVQTDGKIVVSGHSGLMGNAEFMLLRLNSTGLLDNSFDGDGIATTDFFGGNDLARSMRLQADGKIILSGSSLNGTDQNFALARYNTDGSLDNTFGTGGKYVVANDGNEDAYGMAMSGTTIYLGGIITVGSSPDFFVTAHVNDAVASPLPLSLLSFTAAKQTGTVQLQWKTGFEQNTSRFYVEQSTDGQNYEKIGEMPAAGTSNTERAYAFTTRQQAGTSVYYRLRAIDKDEKFTLSRTILFRMQEIANALKVFPNPARNTLQVQTSLQGPLQLFIYNMAGVVVQQMKVNGYGTATAISVDIANVSKGLYSLTLTGAGITEKQLFVKE